MAPMAPAAAPEAVVTAPSAKLHEAAKAKRAGFKRPAMWVLVFGWSLAFCAGVVNSAAFGSWGGYATHMTGATTSIGVHLEAFHHGQEGGVKLGHTALTICSFVAGAFVCGLLIDKTQVHFGGKSLYGAALLGNSLLLIAGFLVWPSPSGVFCVAAAAGLQNAMCTNHFGAIVRTTHVTGTLTDIGSTAGRLVVLLLRGRCRRSTLNVLDEAELGVDARKLGVLLPLYLCFLGGCVAGAYLYSAFGHGALLFPACATGSVGLAYMLFRQRLKEQLKRMERERLSEELADVEGALQRAHSYMSALQQAPADSAGKEVEGGTAADLDAEVAHALEVVHDVEACLSELCAAPRHQPTPAEAGSQGQAAV